MSLLSKLKTIFKSETRENSDLESIPVFTRETPQKIIETRIKPIKIPTIVDLVDRINSIFYELNNMKEEMVTKSWFETQYEDNSDDILKKLNNIEGILININSELSNFTKIQTETKLLEFSTLEPIGIPERIYNIIKNKKSVRYKDIVSSLPYSDPSISKYLKILVNDKKIKRTKIGKAVFYEVF